jgi:hypothetical protein
MDVVYINPIKTEAGDLNGTERSRPYMDETGLKQHFVKLMGSGQL